MLTCVFDDGGKGRLRHVVVDTLVEKDGKILLVKRSPKLSDGGKWALPGGYLDRDEEIIEGAMREVLEETGWKVQDLKLLTIMSSPTREDITQQQNVSFVWLGKASEQVQEPDWESDEVKWFTFISLPPDEQIAFDHAAIIKLYRRHLEEGLSLPIIA